MKRLLVGILLGVCALYAANVNDWNGTWKLNVAKSDYSKNTYVAPREGTLTFANDGWTYRSTDAKGQQQNSSGKSGSDVVSGGENITTVHTEPMANPFVRDVRFGLKDTGKEAMRVICMLLPDGNTIVMYDSGIAPDGKEWSDVRYFEKVK
ncbi:MAG: hypothetical protein M3Y72_20285 [Acidobacteriota bacterium]|nr:hypothetical protein [Acidobacteriota bacterium]